VTSYRCKHRCACYYRGRRVSSHQIAYVVLADESAKYSRCFENDNAIAKDQAFRENARITFGLRAECSHNARESRGESGSAYLHINRNTRTRLALSLHQIPAMHPSRLRCADDGRAIADARRVSREISSSPASCETLVIDTRKYSFFATVYATFA
jgi:hypothetical protein